MGILREIFAEKIPIGKGHADVIFDNPSLLKAWKSEDHPRGDDGRFIDAQSLHQARTDPKKAAELREKVTNPEERAKLDEAIGAEGNTPDVSPELAAHIKPGELDNYHALLAKMTGAYNETERRQSLHDFLLHLLGERHKEANPAAATPPTEPQPAPETPNEPPVKPQLTRSQVMDAGKRLGLEQGAKESLDDYRARVMAAQSAPREDPF